MYQLIYTFYFTCIYVVNIICINASPHLIKSHHQNHPPLVSGNDVNFSEGNQIQLERTKCNYIASKGIPTKISCHLTWEQSNEYEHLHRWNFHFKRENLIHKANATIQNFICKVLLYEAHTSNTNSRFACENYFHIRIFHFAHSFVTLSRINTWFI